MEKLIKSVEEWAREKGILDKATPLSQMEKTFEECHELQEALYFQNNGMDHFTNSKGVLVDTESEITDAIGDILVTVIIQAKLQDVDVVDCLESAYNTIKNRTGKMVDGKFVKDN